jgi:hypothetical protein
MAYLVNDRTEFLSILPALLRCPVFFEGFGGISLQTNESGFERRFSEAQTA